MKVILNQEVRGVGAPGDIVEVADGYGRNYLLPRNLARLATAGAVRQAEGIRSRRVAREIADLEQARTVAAHLESLRVVVKAKAGKEGRLFGSITTPQIVDAVARTGGTQIDRRRIHLDSAIKSIGTHRITVRLHPEVEATVNVEVVPA
ncbi:MAG TPA: 50S ribosomal protein L9 [Actinomycetes bacterium]|nr:50S ribosomal protein L9 [Actinomycetes bacterium]